MNFVNPILKHALWFGPLLILSFALKLYGAAEPLENPTATLRAAASILQGKGYSVQIERVGNGRLIVRHGVCVAQLRLMDSHATTDSFYRSKLKTYDKIRYAWRGKWYQNRPTIGPLLEYYTKREFVRRGVALDRIPLWIAGIGKDCGPSLSADFSTTPLQMQPAASRYPIKTSR